MKKTILLLVLIYSDILTSADKTPKYIYFSEGETVTLMCMGDANTTSWAGPAHNTSKTSLVPEVDVYGKDKLRNTTLYHHIYTHGRKINPDIPNFRRLKVVDTGEKGDFDLQISNISISDEGFYRCDIYLVTGKPLFTEYILQLRKLPSNLTIDNETDEDTIIGREDQLLKITCNFESGSPPATIFWQHNGTILKTGGPNRLMYEFRTSRTHHNSKFTCGVKSKLTDEPLTKTIRLNIKYRPKVFITHDKNMPVFEGANATLCCKIDSNPSISFILWYKDNINITSSINSSCLFFKRLDRQDRGNYTCFAGNEIGKGSFETTLTVYYPPSVYLEYKNFSINESKRAVQCKADGIPNNITFFRLEHLSDFNEYIRYLDVSSDGIAKLPTMTKSKRYQDTGFYLCTASNGVSDKKGNMFQHYKAYIVSTAKHSSEEKAISSEGIVIVVLLILIVVLLVVMGIYLWYLKQRYRKRMITTTNVQTADEVVHYIEIVEVNNELAILHEQNNQMISTDARIIVENRNISMASEEQHLAFSNNDNETSEHTIASSDNDSHSSEHLDDGYERPYTTLVAHNYAEEEHVYNNAKTNLLHDNSATFQNATYRHFVAITEQYALQNNTNTHFVADDSQENIKQSKEKYINLCLKE